MRLGYLDCVTDPYTTPVQHFRGLGAFGKGFVAPSPAPPSGPSPWSSSSDTIANAGILPTAFNKKTGGYYHQDPSCPQGERTATINCSDIVETQNGCQVSACCDLTGGPPGCPTDCDPPGTMVTECMDDPEYAELPDQKWESCEQVAEAYGAVGAPRMLADKICKAFNLPPTKADLMKAQVAKQQEAQQQAVAQRQQVVAQQNAANAAASAAMEASQRQSARQSALTRSLELRRIRAQRAAQRKALAGLAGSDGNLSKVLLVAGLAAAAFVMTRKRKR